MTMFMFAAENPDKQFAVDSVTPQQRQQLAGCPVGWGVQHGDILISTRPLRLDQNADRQIVAVCSRSFTNVPQYMFRRAPPRHAAAFSDGSTTLLSAHEYAALDHAIFVPVSKLITSP
jgi:hypothetical protein